MKKMKFLSFLVAALFGFSFANAQTADEIAAKYVDAIGGAANWKKVNSFVQTGTMSVQGADVNVVRTIVHNKGSRQDISMMGMNFYLIVTPTEGWSYMPKQGPPTLEAMTGDELKEAQDQLDAQGNLIDYKQKGHSIELLGKEDVDGTDCYKLKVTLKSGTTETMFIDSKTYLLIKLTSVRKANDQEMELSTTFSNYQKQPEGIVIPMSISVPLGPGFNADYSVTKVEINKAVDESIFKPAK